jgi:hypothetical protein
MNLLSVLCDGAKKIKFFASVGILKSYTGRLLVSTAASRALLSPGLVWIIPTFPTPAFSSPAVPEPGRYSRTLMIWVFSTHGSVFLPISGFPHVLQGFFTYRWGSSCTAGFPHVFY